MIALNDVGIGIRLGAGGLTSCAEAIGAKSEQMIVNATIARSVRLDMSSSSFLCAKLKRYPTQRGVFLCRRRYYLMEVT